MTPSGTEVGQMSGGKTTERRDTSPAGLWNRDKFEASLGLLHALGLPLRVIEYYRERARDTQDLPHELVARVVEDATPGSKS
ncbi:MAG TPA: hypothetical protein VJT33_17125 [bacterium]|nr:hypothetical protein [bacterium]